MPSIGEILQTERERQGRTLKEVAAATYIKETYLQALEKGVYDEIPGAVFVKGFIRNYGEYLGLDGAALVEEYKTNVIRRSPKADVRPVIKSKKMKKKPAAAKKKYNGKWYRYSLICGIVIVLVLLAWLFV